MDSMRFDETYSIYDIALQSRFSVKYLQKVIYDFSGITGEIPLSKLVELVLGFQSQ